MDFTYRRLSNGPDHSMPGEKTQDFELEENAGFGEQTAAVYDPKKITSLYSITTMALKRDYALLRLYF